MRIEYEGIPESDDITFNTMIPILTKFKNLKILEAGCGTGVLAKYCKSLGNDVYACDLKNYGLPKNIKFSVQDLNNKVTYKDSTFDVIVASEVLEHLENGWEFMREMYRILKPNGVMIVSTPNPSAINCKLRFLFQNEIPYFSYGMFKEIYHVTPIFDFIFNRMIESKFHIIKTIYIPHKKFGIIFPKNKWFSYNTTWVLRKI